MTIILGSSYNTTFRNIDRPPILGANDLPELGRWTQAETLGETVSDDWKRFLDAWRTGMR